MVCNECHRVLSSLRLESNPIKGCRAWGVSSASAVAPPHDDNDVLHVGLAGMGESAIVVLKNMKCKKGSEEEYTLYQTNFCRLAD